jgi:hypothetical protein
VSFWLTEADTGTSTVFVDEKCRFEIAPAVVTTKAAESFAAFAVSIVSVADGLVQWP